MNNKIKKVGLIIIVLVLLFVVFKNVENKVIVSQIAGTYEFSQPWWDTMSAEDSNNPYLNHNHDKLIIDNEGNMYLLIYDGFRDDYGEYFCNLYYNYVFHNNELELSFNEIESYFVRGVEIYSLNLNYDANNYEIKEVKASKGEINIITENDNYGYLFKKVSDDTEGATTEIMTQKDAQDQADIAMADQVVLSDVMSEWLSNNKRIKVIDFNVDYDVEYNDYMSFAIAATDGIVYYFPDIEGWNGYSAFSVVDVAYRDKLHIYESYVCYSEDWGVDLEFPYLECGNYLLIYDDDADMDVIHTLAEYLVEN